MGKKEIMNIKAIAFILSTAAVMACATPEPISCVCKPHEEAKSCARDCLYEMKDLELTNQQDEAFTRWSETGDQVQKAWLAEQFFRVGNERIRLRDQHLFGNKEQIK